MADIKLKDRNDNEIAYTGVSKLKVPAADGGGYVTFQLPPVMQEKAVTITANGTTSIVPDEGKVLSKVDVTVNVPATPTQEKAVPLSMADGDQVVTPDEGNVLTKVTVQKPSTLAPENIKKDVNIGGVVGALESGGGANIAVYKGNLVVASVTAESIVFVIQEGQFPIGVMSNIATEASHIFIFSVPEVVPANGYLYKDSPSDSLFIINARPVGTPSYVVDTANNAITLNGLYGAEEVQVGLAYIAHFVAPSIS